tara:strand:- start:1 stop:570 length:570 start_codon:yes stop_codon:yes gene_type:complete
MEDIMERKGFIGGSDAVKIMRGEWLELWKIKTGRIEPDNLDHVLPVQIGILTEDLNLSWFEREEDNFITHKQLKIKKDLDGVPIKGTIDGKTLLSTSDTSCDIIEAKHTNAFNNMKKVSEYYQAQMQLYMWLAEADNCYLSVIFGNLKWDWTKIPYDESYIATLLDMIKEFWGYIERDEEPDINRGEGL